MRRTVFTLSEWRTLQDMIASQPDRVAGLCVRYRIDPRLMDIRWQKRFGWQIAHIEAAYARRCDRV